MWSLTFITRLAHVLHVCEVVIHLNRRGAVIERADDARRGLAMVVHSHLLGCGYVLVRARYLSFRTLGHYADLSRCWFCILLLIGQWEQASTNLDYCLRINAFLKLHDLIVFQDCLAWLPVNWKVNDADQLLIFVSHGEKFKRADHWVSCLIVHTIEYGWHFWSWKICWWNIHALGLGLLTRAALYFEEVNEYLFIVEFGDPFGLIYSSYLRKTRLRVVALAVHL